MNDLKISQQEIDKFSRKYKLLNNNIYNNLKNNSINLNIKNSILEIKSEEENIKKFKPIILKILSYFKCMKCGNCCKNTNPNIANIKELYIIYNKVGENIFDALENQNTLKSPCYFIKENLCNINKIKPLVCCIYPFSLCNPGGFSLVSGCSMSEEIKKDILNFGIKIDYTNEELQKQHDNIYNSNKNLKNRKEMLFIPYNLLPEILTYIINKSNMEN